MLVKDEAMNDKQVASELVKIVQELADPFAGVKLSSLYVKFETWITKEINKRPASAPISVQMMKGMANVRKRLANKMALTGREAVEALVVAMKKDFTMDAAPIPFLMRKYGSEAAREIKQMWRGY